MMNCKSANIISILSFLILSLLMSLDVNAQDSNQRVFVVKVDGMIDNGLHSYIERSLAAAESENAAGLILHMDTFGGLVDAADKIRNTLLNAEITTVTFIDKKAISAGALISFATDSIYMAPGSSIGAATVVDGGGEKADEKAQSFMRGLMRSTAEAKGRDPRYAEAMVDERIAIEGVIEEGQLLTLSTSEAVELGVANGSIRYLDDVMEQMGWSELEKFDSEERWEESVLRFLANPVISSMLMMMMLGGLYFELQSPGVGFPGSISAIGAMLFFAPLYILGLAESWEILIVLLGILLIIVEVFVIPGFGIAGITGVSLLIFGLFASMVGNVGFNFPTLDQMSGPIWTLAVTLILLVALIMSLYNYLPENRTFNKLVLSATTDSNFGYTSSNSLEDLNGSTGVALTALRPSGTVIINDSRIDVTSEGDFIEKGAKVRVSKTVGSRVWVKSI